ncbi:MAG: hypothetical protein ACM30I_04750 [Gemmatimonas sp.]
MSTIGTITAARPDSAAFGAAIGTRFALALLADANDGLGASGAPASPQPPAVPAIPLETGVDFSTLFAIRYAAALRAASRRKTGDQRSRKEGSSW